MRFLHTMLRVRDLDASLDFFTKLGLRETRRHPSERGRFTLVFLGTGAPGDTAEIELTYNWDTEAPYSHGSGYGHVALGVPDVYKACERLSAAGVKIPRPAGPMAHGGSVIAFIEDPDGYRIELVQRS